MNRNKLIRLVRALNAEARIHVGHSIDAIDQLGGRSTIDELGFLAGCDARLTLAEVREQRDRTRAAQYDYKPEYGFSLKGAAA
jgi:hypothetical protein